MKNLFLVISTIRWQDVVDIVLNSFILFRLYLLFRDTYVFRILLGLASLWFFQRISLSLGLVVTSWIVQGVIAAAALIIIVVFRDEIRSVLQVRSLKAILWGSPRAVLLSPIDLIVDAVFEMAEKRIGALLVLPGKEDLGEIVQNGIRWRGVLSKEMLISIFWPNNPVHDGAAIIKDGRVSDVGVILPLSRRADLPSYYGTRHRAATGLAQMTDSLVIVVSEERGQVSVARGSNILPMYGSLDLIRELRSHLGVADAKGPARRRKNMEIAIAAAASVFLITGVWFSFTRGLDTLISIDVPIEYLNRDPKMVLVDSSANSVNLGLSGSGTLIRSIRPDQVKVRIDLSQAVVGSNPFIIRNDNLTLPPGIVVKKVEPRSIQVIMDIQARKEVPVQVDWVGRLPNNSILTETKLDPATVQVVGPQQALRSVSTLYTEKIPLESLEKSGRLSVGILMPQTSISIAAGSKDKTTVEYVVKERNSP